MSISTLNMDNENWFKIQNVDGLRPFFMSIVSDSNHWMFISSNGGLSAGRKNAEYALFPYYTDDKITEFAPITGSKTIFQIKKDDQLLIWEPFSDHLPNAYTIQRNLYKNKLGNKIRFEETNIDLELTFRYEWSSSNQYGFLRSSMLTNNGQKSCKIGVLDGIQNILPASVNSDLQTRSSNLVDAYKRSELVQETGLGIFALSAIIVDKAEPSEALKANVAWSFGLEKPHYLLSSKQLNAFRKGQALTTELDVKGEKGAYFVSKELVLEAKTSKNWGIVANVNQNHPGVIALNEAISSNSELITEVQNDVTLGSENLLKLVAASDGLQQSADEFKDARHYSNVLFNIMRGGIFDFNYRIEKNDFSTYLSAANNIVFESNQAFLDGLADSFDKFQLDEKLAEVDDPDLKRLAVEYLPLKFSRRHGDPSRPWNKFSINTHNEIDGSKILDYEGNWRDIFQNWEALAYSYPAFLEGMIFKFLNATTFDGYNPYRVTKGGFDWETIEADDPWSYIGYWGDHQIIYLLKLLEAYQKFQPEDFKELFNRDLFVYANVPYRIKSYKEITQNPKDTIDFDHESDLKIRDKVSELGADGALKESAKASIHRVNFMEKMLATVLAKVANFIPEGGIWMNTQRPEWNDANNALVGNGVSMVTLYYLRRFLKFIEPFIAASDLSEVAISQELRSKFNHILDVLTDHKDALNGSISDAERKNVLDGLGEAASTFRLNIYEHGFSGEKEPLSLSKIHEFIETTLAHLEQSIRTNKRADGLYHAYNLMSYSENGVSISYLDEMLEGQVAVLSSGYLSASESLAVLDALRISALYRVDQQSYILYPNKQLKGFLQRNNIPVDLVHSSELLQKMIEDGHFSIINKDVIGGYHFNGNFKNVGDVKSALNELQGTEYANLIAKDKDTVFNIFESCFNHKAFTGRSGTFYGYEGLGSIYWHMVSKLHLAVYEVCEMAAHAKVDESIRSNLAKHFDEIGQGIGVHKSPELYGAFPTDPYSHTPQHRGAQQPGMTGQVKEDILVRIGELGVQINNGQIHFNPTLLKKREFVNQGLTIRSIDLSQDDKMVTLPENALAFNLSQVPVIYQIAEQEAIDIIYTDGKKVESNALVLDASTSASIFNRKGLIKQLIVSIPESKLRD